MTSQWLRFRNLCKKEPRLLDLYRKVAAISDDKSKSSFCANSHWYGFGEGEGIPGGLREMLDDLVGFFAENPKLRTFQAHDLARRFLYDELPDCRSCTCLPLRGIVHERSRRAAGQIAPPESGGTNDEVTSGA